MRSALKLFLVLLTLSVILFAWMTRHLDRPVIQATIVLLIGVSLAGFFSLNILEEREKRKRRRARESKERPGEKTVPGTHDARKVSRADTSFHLSDRKSGLVWGGGNIKASEAKRGPRRKFLGR